MSIIHYKSEGRKFFIMKISESFDLYCSDNIVLSGKSKNTESSYQNVKKSIISLLGDISIEDLSLSEVRDWRDHISSLWKPNTIRNAVSCLRMVLKLASRRGYNVISYDDIIVPKKAKYAVQYLLPDEVESFISVISRKRRGYSRLNRLRNIAILRLLFSSGIRVSELCSLNRSSIRKRRFTVVGKSKDPRVVFIDTLTELAIDDYLSARSDNNPALFISHQGLKDRLTPGGVRRIFSFACSNSSFTGVTPHTIRHSFATMMLDFGVDLCYISDLLGHQSLNTTRIYTHYSNTKLQHIYDSVMV